MKNLRKSETIVISQENIEALPIKKCNLKFQITNKIPVIFHNLRGYDSHFIMQEIGAIIKKHTYKVKGKDGKEEEKEMNINVIPNNMEKYMAIMLGNNLNLLIASSL